MLVAGLATVVAVAVQLAFVEEARADPPGDVGTEPLPAERLDPVPNGEPLDDPAADEDVPGTSESDATLEAESPSTEDVVAPTASTTCAVLARGCYRDADGTLRNADLAYRAMRPHVEAHPGHAAIWSGSFLGAGMIWYWSARKSNSVDWDGSGWRDRFRRDAFRYDNNRFPMNFVMHPMAGSSFYGFARSNDVGILASAAYAVGTSFGWEFGIEFREKFSVNDILMTGNSGIVLGEFFYKLNRYLNSAPGGGGRRQRALAWSAGLPVALQDYIHGRGHVDSAAPRDSLGFSADFWHRFRVSLGYASLAPSDRPVFGMLDVFADAELVAIPGYLREGEFHRWFADGDRTRFSLRGMFGAQSPGWEVESDAVLAGYYRQRIVASSGTVRGDATLVGLDLGYAYRNLRMASYTDQWSSLHLPGIAIEQHFVAGPLTIRIGGEMNPDFTGAYAIGYRAWQQDNPFSVGKNILEFQQYYYGWGYSARAHVDVFLPFVELGLRATYGYVNSREGLSRHQEALTTDQPLRDRMLDVQGSIRVIPFRGLFVEATVLRQSRHSVIESITNDRHLMRTTLSVGVIR